MKKIVCLLLLGAMSLGVFAQKIIDNPDYEFSSFPGNLTKLELNETATILHFHLKTQPNSRIWIPKMSYIQDTASDEKLFITKSEGVEMKAWVTVPSSGEMKYQLYFPKLNPDVEFIEFGEANDGGDWFMYDILINELESPYSMPKALRGNWMLTDGSNRWDYSFNLKNAVVNKQVWNYKSVTSKGKKYTIVLENGNTLKTIYAKLSKDGIVSFGNTSKDLKDYSISKTFKPDFSLENDDVYQDLTFSLDSTIYEGIIKGFSKKLEQKTGMVYVNNPFKGGQESHLVKINEDGSFYAKFPITHPQTVFMRMPTGSYSVFVEPKEDVFHYIYGKKSFFIGDNAQVNSDLDALKDIRFTVDGKIRKQIGELSPEAYKMICNELRDKTLEELKAYQKDHFVSAKGLQIKNIDLELAYYQELLGYDMHRRSLLYQNRRVKKEEDKMPYKEFKVENGYYDFIPKEIVDSRLHLLSNGYYFFVNRLIYADAFKADLSPSLTKVEIANWLTKNNMELTVEELNMVELSKQIETPEIIEKQINFRNEYGSVEQGFYRSYRKYFDDVTKSLKDETKTKHNHFILNVVDYLNANNIEITDEEAEMVEGLRILKTPLENEQERQFNKEFRNILGSFSSKYKDHYSEIARERLYTARDRKIKSFFDKDEALLFDVIKMQTLSKKLEDFKVYSDDQIAANVKSLNTPFLKDYLVAINEETKQKIEINKTKGGYTVHNVEKSEGDELFASMIEKFKGKVVYVDFWATWCGPCKSGIRRITPLKEEMKNEDVVFLYVTNQTSPEGTWKNAIANIKGEHYRVSADEWNYLSKKFNISGIPHYVLVNKEGTIVKPKMGHLSNSRLKSIFKEEMAK